MDVGVSEATERLPELLERVQQGEAVVLTHDGQPVAVLNPPPSRRPLILKSAASWWPRWPRIA